jgi:hypothetical protein
MLVLLDLTAGGVSLRRSLKVTDFCTYFCTILQFICGASVIHRQWALSAGKFYKIKRIFFNI